MLLIAAVLAVRLVTWVAQQVTRQLDEGFAESDALVRSEATKHRQAVASVIQWVSIVMIAIWVIVQIGAVLQFSVGGLIAPATVLGAALGFGAQQLVKDLLSGFFIIVEKQYGFGDLVSLTVTGIAAEARGTVEDVTLRVTRLRSSEGELFTIPNGQIVKTVNLSKDWARAVIDIPVSTSADLNRVNEVLHQECEHALDNPVLGALLLDAPTVMGIESIEVDTVTLRVVARTLPGKQFEAGRQLRVIVIRALERAGIFTTADATVAVIARPRRPRRPGSRRSRRRQERRNNPGCGASAVKFTLNVLEKRSDDEADRSWPRHMLGGRVRTSTIVLIVVFLAMWWTYDTYKPQPPAHEGPRLRRWCRRDSCRTPTTPGCRAAGYNSRPLTRPRPRRRPRRRRRPPPVTTTTTPPPFVLPTLPCIPPFCTPSTTPTPSPQPGPGPVPTPVAPRS